MTGKHLIRDAAFEVRFVAPGINPSKISLRAVADTLTALQDITSGRDPTEPSQVPPEKRLNLIKVRKGSAIYRLLAHDPAGAFRNLARVGAVLAATAVPLNATESNADAVVALLRPLQALSRVTRSLKCTLEVHRIGAVDDPIFSVTSEDFSRVSERMFLTAESTQIGSVERVGGATGMRCVLRIPSRPRLLYCDVTSREVARRLGQHLYEQVVARGMATWLHQSWKLYEFKISDFEVCPRLDNVQSAVNELRSAGLDAWDSIDDPQAFLRG